MAVELVQSATGYTVGGTYTYNVSVSLSSAPTEGNLLVLLVARDRAPAIGNGFMTPPSGYTFIQTGHPNGTSSDWKYHNSTAISSGTYYGFSTFYKIAGASESSTATTTFPYNGGNANLAILMEFSGCDAPVTRYIAPPISSGTDLEFSKGSSSISSSSMVVLATYAGALKNFTAGTGWTLARRQGYGTGAQLSAEYRTGITSLPDVTSTVSGGGGCGLALEIPESGTTINSVFEIGEEVTCGASGDYTTVQAALNAGTRHNGIYKVKLIDNATYSESVQLNAYGDSEGQAYKDQLHYFWLTADSSVAHTGTPGTGATIDGGSAEALRIQDEADYTRVDNLEFVGGNSGGVVEVEPVSRIYAGQNILFDKCIIDATGTSGTDESGIFIRGGYIYFNSVYISNCMFVDNQTTGNDTRGFIWLDHNTGMPNSRVDVYVDHCSADGAIWVEDIGNNDFTVNLNLYNSWFTASSNNASGGHVFYDQDQGVRTITTLNGSHNAFWAPNGAVDENAGTDNTTNWNEATQTSPTTTTTTNTGIIVASYTQGSEDFTPVKATGSGVNVLLGNATDRIGSEPHAFQDFSTDIKGNVRLDVAGKIDIGAFQISGAAGFKYWDGTAFVDSTAVQYWNGTAWTDVTGIQYWNGSAWTDPS